MNDIIKEIRKRQDEVIVMVNSAFDGIINTVKQINYSDIKEDNDYEIKHPITNTAGFKSKKVIAIFLNGQREITPTWKRVVELILKDAITDEEKKKKLYSLRDRILGRKRKRLSSEPTDMRSPLKLDEDLYVETHYDTETLMNLLLQILNEISYDYSEIQIIIKS